MQRIEDREVQILFSHVFPELWNKVKFQAWKAKVLFLIRDRRNGGRKQNKDQLVCPM